MKPVVRRVAGGAAGAGHPTKRRAQCARGDKGALALRQIALSRIGLHYTRLIRQKSAAQIKTVG